MPWFSRMQPSPRSSRARRKSCRRRRRSFPAPSPGSDSGTDPFSSIALRIHEPEGAFHQYIRPIVAQSTGMRILALPGRRWVMRSIRGSVSGTALAAALMMFVLAKPILGAEDTEGAMQALVRVRATVPAEATTAPSLGTEREGNGIVIDSNGLILT